MVVASLIRIALVVRRSRVQRVEVLDRADRCTAPPRTEPTAASLPVVAMVGDGTVIDAASSVDADQRWTALLEQDADIRIETFASSGAGRTVEGTQGRTLQQEVARAPSDAMVVVLFGGSADVDSSELRISRAAGQAVSEVQSAAPDARIAVVGPLIDGDASAADDTLVRTTLQSAAGAMGPWFTDPEQQAWLNGDPAQARDLGAASEKTIAAGMSPVVTALLQTTDRPSRNALLSTMKVLPRGRGCAYCRCAADPPNPPMHHDDVRAARPSWTSAESPARTTEDPMTSAPRQDLLDEPSGLDVLEIDPLGTDPARPHVLLASKPWAMVVAQFFPVLALGLSYPVVVAQLESIRIAGVGLSVLMVSCAVITPTLAQAVAAPVYLHLLGERGVDPHHVARTVLRVAGPALLVVTPLLVAASVGVGLARELPIALFGAFFGLLLLHVAMGALIVPAYALRAPLLLILPWSAYVLALLAAPSQLWAPPTVAIAAQAVTLVLVGWPARRSVVQLDPVRVTYRAGLAAALRGAAEGLPLWSIPAVVWLLDIRLSSIGFVYIALLPGVLAHQLFFVRTVDPGWRLLETARSALHEEPYAQARERFDRFGRGIRAGVGQATGLLLMLSLVLVSAAVVMHWIDAPLLVVVVAAAFAAVAAMMQGYTIAMLGSAAPLAVLGGGSLVVVVTGVALRLPDLVVLSAAAVVYAVYALASIAVSRRTMHRPEYALFWRRAVQW